jgi:hypothetical protein
MSATLAKLKSTRAYLVASLTEVEQLIEKEEMFEKPKSNRIKNREQEFQKMDNYLIRKNWKKQNKVTKL